MPDKKYYIWRGKSSKKNSIYFYKHLTNNSLTKIGNYFSSISYSAVSQICKRLTIEMDNNKKPKKDIDEIGTVLSNVKT
jgi:chromosomal replication initiation ATPase DnaA